MGDDSVIQAKGSQETEEFFKQHQCNTKQCVLCYTIYYSSLCTEETKSLLPSGFFESITSEEQDQRRNYFMSEKVDVQSAISGKLGAAIDVDSRTDCEGVKHLYSYHFASLYSDVMTARTPSFRLDWFFDTPYTILLRQLLEKNGISCDRREKSTKIESEVELIAKSRDGNTVLLLESAMNGNEAKTESDLGKLTMEMYRVWEQTRECPPLGVLVRPFTGYDKAKRTVFEVYTMVQKAKTNCLVALDVFMAPMTQSEVGLHSESIEPCENFVTLLPNGVAETRSNKSFIEACNSVNRIVEACKAIALLMDDGVD